MLRKVLKYDLNSTWRLWTVFSVTILLLSILGGLSLGELVKLGNNTDNIAIIRGIGAYFGIMIYGGALSIYSAGTYLLCAFRFYKNLFTDEAYLTFTLPVKRSTILNAKLLNAFIWSAATNLVSVISLALVFTIAPGPNAGGTLIHELFTMLYEQFNLSLVVGEFSWWILVILSDIITILASMLSPLLLYACVTFGCTLVKKHKLLMSILVYYVANVVLGCIAYVVYIVGIFCAVIIGLFTPVITEAVIIPLIYLVPVAVIMFLIVLCVSTYAFILHRIEKKLNLA